MSLLKPKIAIIGLSGQSVFMNVDRFPHLGETISAKNIHIEPGGKGYNQAVAASKLGADVSFLTAVGSDHYGKVCMDILKEYNIKVKVLEKNKKTAFASILTDKKGDNEVIVYHGASLEKEDIKIFVDEIKNADILLLQLETPISIIKKAIAIAKEYNTFIILNPAPAINLDGYILESVNLLTPNEVEANTIFKIINRNNCRAIITLGSKGALILDQGKEIRFPTYKVETVDTTGAGDTFNAALAVEIGKGRKLNAAVRFANAAAALSVTKNYVIDSLPTKTEVDSFLNKHNVK